MNDADDVLFRALVDGDPAAAAFSQKLQRIHVKDSVDTQHNDILDRREDIFVRDGHGRCLDHAGDLPHFLFSER